MPRAVTRFALALTLFGVTLFQGSPSAVGPACDKRDNNSFEKLTECVTLEGVRAHQAALQQIAADNGGSRAVGTAGYAQSVAYAQQVLTDAGYLVTLQEFQFEAFVSLAPSVLDIVAPTTGAVAHQIAGFSGSGDVTAAVALPSPNTGCLAADWAGFPAGNIALIARGGCTFSDKVNNALSAGASGAVLYNDVPGPLLVNLGAANAVNKPVVGISQADGQTLAATPGLQMHLVTSTFVGQVTTQNVLAESKGGDPANVVMAGAHLDSFSATPGINDNGSGVAAILEIARQMKKVKPRNKVRFALWAAEPQGRAGSGYYINNLSPAEQDRIALYLNFDVIGSPNYGLFLYDGDGSDGGAAGPGGSEDIEKTFEDFYDRSNVPHRTVPFSSVSDHRPFADAGIPGGGLFTGTDGNKTAEQAALWGGTAGVDFDPCWRQACDTYDNVGFFALDFNSDAAAVAILKYAMSTEEINGIRGKNLQWKTAKK